MRLKKLFLVLFLLVLGGGVLSVLLGPFVIKTGLRLWIARTAEQEGLQIRFGKIDAPLLRPAILYNLEIESQPDAPFQLKIESPRVELGLNLLGFFDGARGNVLRTLNADGISVDLRRNSQAKSKHLAWRALSDLRADDFRLARIRLHFDSGETVIDLRDGLLSGSQIEAGIFSVGELNVISPLFRKSFSHLRGTTSWQENRLTIGALTLTRGLDIDSINIDLSQIGESRIGLELSMDAFGGKLRASVSSDEHGDDRTWDVAGSASELSLAQLSEALDFTDCASGSLHACKFTFRGETTNLRQATAAIWAEVTGLTWRDRTADTIIIGASLYNRQVQIEQLYVKQHENQLTLTGEFALPEKLSDWLNPDFRGDISASINQLGDFARLFGARPSDFDGKVEISGKVSAQERKLGGQLQISGHSLVVFRAPVESLEIKLELRESRLEIEKIELCRKNDFFRGQADIDLARGGSYSGQFSVSVAEAADYRDLLPEPIRSLPVGGSINLDWMAQGDETKPSGTFHVRGHGLRLLDTSAIPFEAEIEGEYSLGNFFFRKFSLSNPHASLSAFVTIAKNYAQLQSLRFDLNGVSKLSGDLFIPISLSKWQVRSEWLAMLGEAPSFDLNLTLDSLDLGELARAVSSQPQMSGQASGNLVIEGPIASLEGKSTVRLENFAFGIEPPASFNGDAQLNQGVFRGNASLLGQGSNPMDFEWSIPYQFEKHDASYALRTTPPWSARINFPTVMVSKLPRCIVPVMFVNGILSGQLALSDAAVGFQVIGESQLTNARILGGPTFSGWLTFSGQTAAIEYALITRDQVQYAARGELDFHEPTAISARFFPNTPMVALTPLDQGDCINGVQFAPPGVGTSLRAHLGEFALRGSLNSSTWTISLREKKIDDPLELLLQGEPERTYPICSKLDPAGKKLTLGIARPLFP